MSVSEPGAVSPVPEHLHTVTPRLVISDGAAAIAFYHRAFGAEQIGDRFTSPDGELIHAEIRIGDSVVMITEDSVDGPVSSPERLGGKVTCVLSVYWADVDVAWERAGRGWGRGDLSAGGPVLRGARRAAARSVRPAVDDEPAHRGCLSRGNGPQGSGPLF